MVDITATLEGWSDIDDINRFDGVRVSFTDASWVLIRPSGTEPVIRITVEALSVKRAKTLLKDAQAALKQIIT